jgi:hypothetical protein
MIATKTGLEVYQVEDRGISRLLNIPCFKLTAEFNKELHVTIFKLQDILKRAADLIPERETYFKIDPRGIFFKVLRGVQDLGQLHATWAALRKRVKIGLKTFEKYDRQYQTFEALRSLATIALGVYDELEKIPEDRDKLRYLYDSLPHLHLQIHKKARQRTSVGRWESMLHVPVNLTDAYPMRILEDDPKIISYTEDGLKRIHDRY